MFTGIVAGTGSILTLQNMGQEIRLDVEPSFVMDDIHDGESIAINGACLSVEEHWGHKFRAYASRETLAKTNLGALQPGSTVNLERALAMGDRLGGHIVSGHIDCLCTLESITSQGQSLLLRLSFPRQFAPLVVSKGSVALNGISLTVNDCGDDFLEVNVIPDSQRRTNLREWRTGARINMETDILGKYVNHMLRPWNQGNGALGTDFLAMHGFI